MILHYRLNYERILRWNNGEVKAQFILYFKQYIIKNMIINKKTFILFSFIFFLLISLIAIAAYTISARQINHSFIEQQLTIASETIRLRLASIVNSELALVLKLADTPVIRQYFINPSNPELEASARLEFDTYLEHFGLKIVFWVNDIDKIFYSTGNEPYVVDPDDPESYWYNLTLYSTDLYNFNINYNPNMQQIHLWINVLVFNKTDGLKYPVGMLGTGINLSEFSGFIVNAYKDFDENITPYTFNKFGEITSAADYEIVYNKTDIGEHLGGAGTEILRTARALSDGESHCFIYDDKIVLVSSIPEMEWYLAVSYPLPGLWAVNRSMNTVFFSMLFLILFILIVINIYIARSENALEKQNVQLIEANRKSETASRAKSGFLAAMSHELRTPLNTIIGFSEIELNKSLEAAARDNVTRIHQSGLHLLRIINDILDLSKLDSGRFEITPDEYNTAALISSTVDMNIIRIGTKPVQFTLDIDAGFPARLKGDELRIKQIMNNLLSNAIKYTREGTVQLTISSRELNENQVLAVFAVRDTGIGIRAEDIGKLFGDYTQLDTRTNREVEGTGLGLSISRRIAQMMGGDITVESEYGKGSCFTARIVQERAHSEADINSCDNSVIGEETAAALCRFQFPRQSRQFPQSIRQTPLTSSVPEEEEYAALASPVTKETDDVKDAPVSLFTILAVDDHLNNLMLIREQLKPYGIQVDAASSGQEALEKIQADRQDNSGRRGYSLILMDHMMPGMDGIETMKAIRNNRQCADTPIIVLTANALRGMREYYLEQGFTDFIAKPVDQRVLYEVIMKQLTGRERAMETEDAYADNAVCAVFSGGIIKQCVDKLNHIYAAFEISAGSADTNMEIDNEYFARLISLLESLNAMLRSQPHRKNETLLEQTAALAAAAKNKDTQAVAGLLRSCRMDFNSWADEYAQTTLPAVPEIVRRLRKAIWEGDTETTGKTIKELGAASLSSAEREKYFNIYDSLMDDDNEKALERIGEWLE